jgi:hypothetical protein
MSILAGLQVIFVMEDIDAATSVVLRRNEDAAGASLQILREALQALQTVSLGSKKNAPTDSNVRHSMPECDCSHSAQWLSDSESQSAHQGERNTQDELPAKPSTDPRPVAVTSFLCCE